MIRAMIGLGLMLTGGAAMAFTTNGVKATLVVPGVTSLLSDASVELKNDNFVTGGQAYLEQGFVNGEMAGVYVKVPADTPLFKVDSFRVLIGGGSATAEQLFFGMTVADDYSAAIGPTIQNSAQVQTGAYFNDIPAQGGDGGAATLPCAKAGQVIGAYVEFTWDGAPSVYRDLGPINVPGNLINAVPGGWNTSATYGVSGNWILRVVGHKAQPGEC